MRVKKDKHKRRNNGKNGFLSGMSMLKLCGFRICQMYEDEAAEDSLNKSKKAYVQT